MMDEEEYHEEAIFPFALFSHIDNHGHGMFVIVRHTFCYRRPGRDRGSPDLSGADASW
jgi:hypothetical protein